MESDQTFAELLGDQVLLGDGVMGTTPYAQEILGRICDPVAGFAVSAPFGNVQTAIAVLQEQPKL